jgi:hypothetical protein
MSMRELVVTIPRMRLELYFLRILLNWFYSVVYESACFMVD